VILLGLFLGSFCKPQGEPAAAGPAAKQDAFAAGNTHRSLRFGELL
jgi:hypothetical protein